MKIRLTAQARAVWDETGEPVDLATLRTLDGTEYLDETFSDYLAGDPETENLPVSGGHLRFFFDRSRDDLFAVTEYRCISPLSAHQIESLIEYTRGQWSDGIGENFSQAHAEETGIFLEPVWNVRPTVDMSD